MGCVGLLRIDRFTDFSVRCKTPRILHETSKALDWVESGIRRGREWRKTGERVEELWSHGTFYKDSFSEIDWLTLDLYKVQKCIDNHRRSKELHKKKMSGQCYFK